MPSFTKSVFKNVYIQVVGKGFTTLVMVVVVALMTRYLGTEGFGQYTAIMKFIGTFYVLAEFGLYLMVVREYSSEEYTSTQKDHVLQNIFGLRLILSGALFALIGVAGWFIPAYSETIKWGITIASFAYFIMSFTQLYVGIFQTELKMEKIVISDLFNRGLFSLLAVVFIFLDFGLIAIIWALLVGQAAQTIMLYFQGKPYFDLQFGFDRMQWRRLLHLTWPVAISSIFTSIYFNIDTVFLSLMKEESEVGLYGAPYKVLELLVSMPNMFVGLVLPVLAATAFTNWERFKRVYQKSFDLLVIAGAYLVVTIQFLAEEVTMIMAGDEFMNSVPVFRILAFGVFFLFLGALSGHTIIAVNKQRQMAWFYFATMVMGVTLYLSLIPRYSYYGAAIGTLVTEALIMIIGMIIVSRTAKMRLELNGLWRTLVSLIPFAGVLYISDPWFTTMFDNWPLLVSFWLRAVVASIVFLLALYWTKAISKEVISEILKRNNQSIDNI